MKFGR